MSELPAIPDPEWSSIEKAFYCRAQAINLLEEAERAENYVQAEELAGVALRWLALARFHEAESARALMTEDLLRENSGAYVRPDNHAHWNDSAARSRRHDMAQD